MSRDRAAYMRGWRKRNPGREAKGQHGRHLVRRYGVTAERWDEMLIAQQGRCAVCQNPMTNKKKEPCVDHCHWDDTIRELLCFQCNIGVSHLERPGFVHDAMAYLKRNHPERYLD